MLREYDKKTACIILRVGDSVIDNESRIGKIISIELVPNGISDPSLIARLTVKHQWGKIIATADKFRPVIGEKYLES
jgi:hypothetical protein